MKKIKFNNKEEYINYCIDNDILEMPRKYGSQCTDISDAYEGTFYVIDSDIEGCNKEIRNWHIKYMPKEYPCIFCYTEVDYGFIGSFIYSKDFDYVNINNN